jgi:uncharacterized membrane protein
MANLIKLSIIILFLDALFILLSKDLFHNQILKIQNSNLQLKYIGAILAYVFVIFILYWFIIKEKKNIKDAFILGICAYGIYEYTNFALLKNWDFKTTIIDTLWGGTLFALSTYIYNKI